MIRGNDKSGKRLRQTKNPNPESPDLPPDSEAPWQQLMMVNYLMFEAIDAMAQERAAGNHMPLNRHWQQFIHHLRLKKPGLGTCLDKLPERFLAEQQGGMQ
ncbi:hypothetical protein [Sedimenticola sp.]|uniref:hypothetical protein n=1 Tax=Sedimenticola sp. TaxID=1940285 RepID=UPI003D0ED05C